MPFDIEMEWTLEPPGLVARFTPGPQHHGPADALHGGIAALLLDETMAALGHALDRIHTVTGTLNVKFRKPIPLDGRTVRVVAWRESDPRRATMVFGRIVPADDVVAVTAEGVFIRVDKSVWSGPDG
jgi:acyl-coenzyme A thioesterase PaaI-like protein